MRQWLNVLALLQKPDKQIFGGSLLTRISEEIAIVHGIIQTILAESIHLDKVQSGPPLDNEQRGQTGRIINLRVEKGHQKGLHFYFEAFLVVQRNFQLLKVVDPKHELPNLSLNFGTLKIYRLVFAETERASLSELFEICVGILAAYFTRKCLAQIKLNRVEVGEEQVPVPLPDALQTGPAKFEKAILRGHLKHAPHQTLNLFEEFGDASQIHLLFGHEVLNASVYLGPINFGALCFRLGCGRLGRIFYCHVSPVQIYTVIQNFRVCHRI